MDLNCTTTLFIVFLRLLFVVERLQEPDFINEEVCNEIIGSY